MTANAPNIQTAAVAELFDPEIHPPPRGTTLLVINQGGVLIKSTWFNGAMAWGYLPKIPQSVKDRISPTRDSAQNPRKI